LRALNFVSEQAGRSRKPFGFQAVPNAFSSKIQYTQRICKYELICTENIPRIGKPALSSIDAPWKAREILRQIRDESMGVWKVATAAV